ncbi:MAG: sensor histidine kinase [Clostridia bacterium]|nr:sensor histidine kinase [Clostridia bacterium]
MKRKKKQDEAVLENPPVPPKQEGNTLSETEDEAKLRAYFRRIFGDDESFQEDRLFFIGKWVIFGLLLLVEVLILLQHMEILVKTKNWGKFTILFGASLVLTVAEALKMFILKKEKYNLVFYGIEALAACGFVVVTVGVYSLLLYILILTQFYFSTTKLRNALWMYAVALPLYAISYILQMCLVRGDAMGLEILREAFGTFAALTLHFVGMELILLFYRQYVRLNRTLVDLDKSKKELEKAYAVVAEVTALEERQRIAKEIHDTAGHSLTTVIMQTEAAKRIIDTNPAEAKNKLIAANLQAKNTLDRLRESVHVLSGEIGSVTLKTALENIINESTDGTGIKIRAKVEDIYVSEAKHRFLCNTLKEGISNGLRHGNATAFWFELKTEDGKIRFYLSDNGTGLVTEHFESGFGLTTMRDRVRKLGGDMYIMSEPEEGFELNISLPVDEKKDKAGEEKKHGN